MRFLKDELSMFTVPSTSSQFFLLTVVVLTSPHQLTPTQLKSTQLNLTQVTAQIQNFSLSDVTDATLAADAAALAANREELQEQVVGVANQNHNQNQL